MLVVVENHVALGQLALTLDVNMTRPIDHDLANLGIIEQDLQRPEAQDIRRDALEHPGALGSGQHDVLAVEDRIEDIFDLLAHFCGIRKIELWVKLADQLVLDTAADIYKVTIITLARRPR